MTVQRGDWVTARSDIASKLPGTVRRVSRDGTWADVNWGGWSKRMQTQHLIVQHTIQRGGWTITDETRKHELETSEQKGGTAG